MTDRLSKALRSLEGLSAGDAFGGLFFRISAWDASPADLPETVWPWTDDTHMALSIVEVLQKFGHIDQDALAQAFARRYQAEPYRGYAGGAIRLLKRVSAGEDWRDISPTLFGSGSYGNGAAMRAAPIGGYFCDDLQRAAQEAQLSAVVTHAHPEGQAGAIAVAVAAAITANYPWPQGPEFLKSVLEYVPESVTKDRIRLSIDIPPDALLQAIQMLGTGSEVSAQDTVPFCLWNVAYHLEDFESALWQTAKGMGDCDTTCAIVGGIVALSSQNIPAAWLKHREPLSAIV
jgi:ADP-ribosylglycohydrolase